MLASGVLETSVQHGEVSLWTSSQGSGVPVLLCNGGPGCCDYLAPVAAMLEDSAHVIRFEERGCGRSSPLPPYEVLLSVADMEAIRAFYGVDAWVVAGHSWGCDLALAYALGHPDRTLGLVGISGGRVVDDRSWHEAYAYGRDHIGEALPEMAYPFNAEVNEQMNASWKAYIRSPSLLRRIAGLTMPALFVYGGADIRPSWPTEQLAELLPRGRFELVPEAEHLIWATHSGELRELLRAFIQELKTT